MYSSGTFANFEGRLHQLPTGVIDLNLYRLEGKTYFSGISTGVAGEYHYKWNKEFVKQAASYFYPTGEPFL
jgi:hypothetical protein